MKERLYSMAKGTVVAFIAVNTLIGSILAFLFPTFFDVGLLFRPQTLALTIPLSVLFYLDVEYLREYLEDSETEIREMFEEVDPDLGH